MSFQISRNQQTPVRLILSFRVFIDLFYVFSVTIKALTLENVNITNKNYKYFTHTCGGK